MVVPSASTKLPRDPRATADSVVDVAAVEATVVEVVVATEATTREEVVVVTPGNRDRVAVTEVAVEVMEAAVIPVEVVPDMEAVNQLVVMKATEDTTSKILAAAVEDGTRMLI